MSLNIPDALEYYDKLQDKLEPLKKLTTSIEHFNPPYDLEKNILIFKSNKLNQTDKSSEPKEIEIFRAEYEYLAIYFSENNSWVWAWGLPTMRKKQVRTCKTILNYGVDLDPDRENHDLKIHLTTSRFLIDDPYQVEIYVSIASSLAKKYVYQEKKGVYTHYYFLSGLDVTKDIPLETDIQIKKTNDGVIDLSRQINDTPTHKKNKSKKRNKSKDKKYKKKYLDLD